MKPINFPANRKMKRPPSWSWMGSLGRIDYVDVPGNRFDWEHEDIFSPWGAKTRGNGYSSTSQGPSGSAADVTELDVVVRPFRFVSELGTDWQFFFDDRVPRQEGSTMSCVVVAKEKGAHNVQDKKHYVLLVEREKSGEPKQKLFRRIGVGFVSGKHIMWEMSAAKGKLS
jgi:hypothetical protein